MHSADERPIRRVVIAGGGTAGWMTAAALSKTLGRVLDITLVESEEIGTVGVGEATIPTMVTFHRLLDINEQAFMAATQATIKLGIAFENWRNLGEHYIHSFGTTGKDHWTAGFQHFWLEGKKRGLARDYGDYCFELRAAQEERFAHLPNGGINYAFHLDAGRYAKYLRTFSEGFGAKRVEGKIAKVETRADDGHIEALEMQDGSRIEGDLFIDCTGFRGLLIGETLGVGFEDWSEWLFCDSAYAVQTTLRRDPLPYTRSIAGEAGWQWRIPLQQRGGNGHVFSSRFTDNDTAKAALLGSLEGEPLFEPRLLRFTPGQRKRAWEKNCVAIGLSSGFLEPLESTSIHLIQRGIIRLLQCFPAVLKQADIDEYNQQSSAEIVHIRDFIILHYYVTNRRDTPFWCAAATMDIPVSLKHRIELFRETARVFRIPNELFAENSWVQVMLGQGITPSSWHPVTRLMPDSELNGFLESIRAGVERQLRQLAPHGKYLETYCPVKELPG